MNNFSIFSSQCPNRKARLRLILVMKMQIKGYGIFFGKFRLKIKFTKLLTIKFIKEKFERQNRIICMKLLFHSLKKIVTV